MSDRMHQPWRNIVHGPGNPRQKLRMLVALVALLATLATTGFLANSRENALIEARTRTTDAARLLEEHIVRLVRTSDFIVGRAAALGRMWPMERLAADDWAWRELLALSQGLPEPGTLWIVDAKGIVRLGTVQYPAIPTSVADRVYFQAHLATRHDIVIGPLVNTKSRDKQAFHLSRRIEDPQGSFLGVAAAGFDADTFTNFHQTLPLGKKASISVIDLEGHVILRQPDPDRWAGSSIPNSRLMAQLKQGSPTGVLIAASPLDQVERMTAYRLVPEFGVVVVAAEAMEDVLGPWWDSVRIAAMAAAVLTMLLGALVRLIFTGMTREEKLVRGLEETVRERTEEAHEQAEQARRANESKTRFLAAASHDLRQPLQAAGMFVEALSARLDGTPHANIVDKLRQSVDATQSLLTTLLDVSTLEAGKIEPHINDFSIMPLLTNLHDQMEPEAAAKKLTLRVVPTAARVLSDAVLLERMLRNLMVNAVRYTHTGGVVLGCRRRGDHLAICIVDSGIGIPADKLDMVFDDFTRLGEKGGSRGLGLGLGVVRRTAQLLGLTVELRSAEGKGSSFAVIVPLAK
ncbi:MAG: sensor histidine kinase [Rhodospirillaceae bacterium]|nr:sensor histidine kinase [Rhodospirillales bacterium]